MCAVIGIKGFVSVSQDRLIGPKGGNFSVTVIFETGEAGRLAAEEFRKAIEDGNLYGTNPNQWRKEHGFDKPADPHSDM